ncbi:MAG: hypothetical protein JSS87_13345 [Acidobacteria bacterium]|nr:hypothetical protein [Acidobacteriota bacterium]
MVFSVAPQTWVSILAVVTSATAGDILIAHAMKAVDLDAVRAERGLKGAIVAVITSPTLILGIACMAVSFFSLLFSLSGADLSLVAPATASLTFVTTAIAAKFILKENVDRRRWLAALCICVGVVLLAF